jgi:predicted short-subunit dehydrogenase-like oxidoreductase (DUF2520 family)
MKTIAILGAGKLGTTLGRALAGAGYSVKAVSCLSLASAQKSASLITGPPKAFSNNQEAAELGQWIVLTPPDDQIKFIAKELSALPLKNRLVFHCSGLLSADILAPLKKKGAMTASIHPIQTFSSREGGGELFKGIYFTLEGEHKACGKLKGLVKKLGGFSLDLPKERKPTYHAACSFSSNLLVALLQAASDLLKPLEIKTGKEYQILLPLIKQTVTNIEQKGLAESLTGPVIRGDLQTVKTHLAALRQNPQAYRLYRNLAGHALETAAQDIPEDKYRILKDWLEDK